MLENLLPEIVWADLNESQRAALLQVATAARETYGDALLGSGEPVWPHAVGMATLAAELRLDLTSRQAALLFAFPNEDNYNKDKFEALFGEDVARLVKGVYKLNQMRPITEGFSSDATLNPHDLKVQIEVLRKMLLAMVEDVRVVLLRLASRTQTLRFYAHSPDPAREGVARETLELLAPLANRLGVWELKWELEDLSFRFLHTDIYKEIARKLDEKRQSSAAMTLWRQAPVLGGASSRSMAPLSPGRSSLPHSAPWLWSRARSIRCKPPTPTVGHGRTIRLAFSHRPRRSPTRLTVLK